MNNFIGDASTVHTGTIVSDDYLTNVFPGFEKWSGGAGGSPLILRKRELNKTSYMFHADDVRQVNTAKVLFAGDAPYSMRRNEPARPSDSY